MLVHGGGDRLERVGMRGLWNGNNANVTKCASSGWGFRWAGVVGVLRDGVPDSRRPPLALHPFVASCWMAKESPDASVRTFEGILGDGAVDALNLQFHIDVSYIEN